MASKVSFTKAFIDNLQPALSDNRLTYYDAKVPGLQLRVSKNGIKTFCVYKRIKGGGPERITLGRYPELSIESARKKAMSIISDIAEGKNPADVIRNIKAEMTLDELFKEYEERCAKFNLRPDKAKSNYRLYLSKWGKRKISSIKHQEVDKLHNTIASEIGQVTANIALKLLHVMFNKAKNEWRIWDGPNPAHGIKKFKEKSRDRFIQENELPRFFESLMNEPNTMIRDFILISLLTGARRTNVQEMTWEQINFDSAEWCIPVTKNGTPQTIPLSNEAITILTERKLHNTTSEYVFPGTGKTGHLAEPKTGWARILKRANINNLRIHDLRRTLGSWQAKTGASLVIIGKSLNHKNPSTTAIYARLDIEPVRQSVNNATIAIMKAAGVSSNNKRKNIRYSNYVIGSKRLRNEASD
jgi:integrase